MEGTHASGVLPQRDSLLAPNEGFRLALTPQMPHMSGWLVYAALVGFSVFFTWAGLRKFESRALD